MQGHRRRRATQRSPATSISPKGGGGTTSIYLSLLLRDTHWARLRAPIVVIVLGEGGSGGALALSLGDRILMLEHSIYSVISPESCSAILWKDQDHAKEAAEALRLTAKDMMSFKVIDEIVPEPPEGSHTDWDKAASLLKPVLLRNWEAIRHQSVEERLTARFEKFRHIGEHLE